MNDSDYLAMSQDNRFVWDLLKQRYPEANKFPDLDWVISGGSLRFFLVGDLKVTTEEFVEAYNKRCNSEYLRNKLND